MKKIITFAIAVALILIPTVNASTVTWKQITDEWKNLAEDYDGITVTANDSNLKIVSKDLENKEYEFNFKYEDDKIEFIPSDKTNMDELELATVSFAEDIYAMAYMLEIVCELYDVDYSKLDLDEENLSESLNNYGITYDAEKVSYSRDDEMGDISITAENIKEFSIDLNAFEEATKDLVGTYNEDDDIIFEDPTVSLSLSKANSKSLELIVNIDNLPSTSTGKCNIYMIPKEGTAFATGESYIVGTISDCKNGANPYTISNLKQNSKYAFQVELIEETSFGVSNQVLGKNYVTFSTIEKENTNNPDTGSSYIYIACALLITSMISLIVLEKKKLKYNN